MLKIMIIILTLLGSQISFASNHLFFNITAINTTLNITTTIPNHSYTNAGIKINTTGYSLKNAGTDCVPISNGYCLFSVSDTSTKAISLTGSTGNVNMTLCLNGAGPLSCQNATIAITAGPKNAYIANDKDRKSVV